MTSDKREGGKRHAQATHGPHEATQKRAAEAARFSESHHHTTSKSKHPQSAQPRARAAPGRPRTTRTGRASTTPAPPPSKGRGAREATEHTKEPQARKTTGDAPPGPARPRQSHTKTQRRSAGFLREPPHRPREQHPASTPQHAAAPQGAKRARRTSRRPNTTPAAQPRRGRTAEEARRTTYFFTFLC